MIVPVKISISKIILASLALFTRGIRSSSNNQLNTTNRSNQYIPDIYFPESNNTSPSLNSYLPYEMQRADILAIYINQNQSDLITKVIENAEPIDIKILKDLNFRKRIPYIGNGRFLIDAIVKSNIKLIKVLKHEFDLDQLIRNEYGGKTLLHLAAIYSNTKMVRFLIDQNPDHVDLKDNNGNVPLKAAIESSNRAAANFKQITNYIKNNDIDKIVEILDTGLVDDIDILKSLEFSLYLPNDYSINLLEAIFKDSKINAIKTLIDHFDLKGFVKENYGDKNLIHIAAFFNSNDEVLEFLIRDGQDINHKDVLGNNPLQYSIGNNHLEATKELVNKGCKIEEEDLDGNNSLLTAIKNLIIKAMVEIGGQITIKSTVNSRLGNKSYNKNNKSLEIFEYLIQKFKQKNIDLQKSNNDGKTILDITKDLMEPLIKSQPEAKSLIENTEAVKLLLKHLTLPPSKKDKGSNKGDGAPNNSPKVTSPVTNFGKRRKIRGPI